MENYLLFIDTETSGLPKSWNKPYSAEGNWPYNVQLAWIIYTKEGQLVKSENHFIQADDYQITEASLRIHGITSEFLSKNGKDRKIVMSLLWEDLNAYKPLVIAHFMQLDFHMLGLGFYRAGLENPILALPVFCTMIATEQVAYPRNKCLHLSELYEKLFGVPMREQHNALADASATAECFFELLKQGVITKDTIELQQGSYQLPHNKIISEKKKSKFKQLVTWISFLLFN